MIRRIIPYKARILRSIINIYFYDLKKYFKFSSIYNRHNTPSKLKSFLTKGYHVVEKGLTMPETRLGFGKENVLRLINLCYTYDKLGYDLKAAEFIHSLKVLNEYLMFHKKHDFELEKVLTENIKKLNSIFSCELVSEQRVCTKENFISKSQAPFDEFCLSRHTVRNFTSEEIPMELLQDCVKLALSSPSPCNRQPNRVYIIKNKSLMQEVFKLQNGNRGFGHLGNALIVFTSDLSLFHDTYERNEMFLNSGMFAMTLIHALHFHNIGSCALNWSVPIEKDKAIHKLINIPDNEVVTLTLICGYVPDNFRAALSPKPEWGDVTRFII